MPFLAPILGAVTSLVGAFAPLLAGGGGGDSAPPPPPPEPPAPEPVVEPEGVLDSEAAQARSRARQAEAAKSGGSGGLLGDLTEEEDGPTTVKKKNLVGE